MKCTVCIACVLFVRCRWRRWVAATLLDATNDTIVFLVSFRKRKGRCILEKWANKRIKSEKQIQSVKKIIDQLLALGVRQSQSILLIEWHLLYIIIHTLTHTGLNMFVDMVSGWVNEWANGQRRNMSWYVNMCVRESARSFLHYL